MSSGGVEAGGARKLVARMGEESIFIGGNSNSTTEDASIGITGHLFDGGVPVQAVSEMNISDNHLKFWQRLAEVANDPWPYSGQRTPSLVFTDVVVSGI